MHTRLVGEIPDKEEVRCGVNSSVQIKDNIEPLSEHLFPPTDHNELKFDYWGHDVILTGN